jgi:hypothetical protein
VGLTRSRFVRAMAYQSTTKFLPGSRWFLGSLQFVTDRFGDLTLQEPESCGIIGSGMGCLPPAPEGGTMQEESKLFPTT